MMGSQAIEPLPRNAETTLGARIGLSPRTHIVASVFSRHHTLLHS